MTPVEMICDGWIRRHQGKFLVRRNPRHLDQVREAIRNRYGREVEIRIEQ